MADEAPRPLAGMHAVVTGGSRGIGRAIAAHLASLGASLTLLGRDRAHLDEAVQALAADSTACDAQVCDVRDEASVADAFAAIARAGHRVSVLVNNAGQASSAKFADTDRALWDAMIGVNLTGVYHCTRAALPALLGAPAGRVVNVASTAGLTGYPYVAAYCAAKHGVIGLTRALARELARTRVTVNAVCPGYTDTGLLREAIDNIVARTGHRVSVLVNNAGQASSAKFADTDRALWDATIGVNLTGVYHCTRAALPALLAAPAGRVVNVASTAGLTGYPYVAAYCAAKHGVIGLTRALARELAGTRVTVNAVCPGYTDTDLLAEAVSNVVARTHRTDEEARAALAAHNPQRRLIRPEEVALAVGWLCLPQAAAMTGLALPVAGGELA